MHSCPWLSYENCSRLKQGGCEGRAVVRVRFACRAFCLFWHVLCTQVPMLTCVCRRLRCLWVFSSENSSLRERSCRPGSCRPARLCNTLANDSLELCFGCAFGDGTLEIFPVACVRRSFRRVCAERVKRRRSVTSEGAWPDIYHDWLVSWDLPQTRCWPYGALRLLWLCIDPWDR